MNAIARNSELCHFLSFLCLHENSIPYICIWNTIFICFCCFLFEYKRQGNIFSNGIMASSFCGPVIKRQENVVFVYVWREDFYSQQFVPLQFPFMLMIFGFCRDFPNPMSSLSASSRSQPPPLVGDSIPHQRTFEMKNNFILKVTFGRKFLLFRWLCEVSLSPAEKRI